MTTDDYSKLSQAFAVLETKFENIEKGVEDIKNTLHEYIRTEEHRHKDRDKNFSLAMKEKADIKDVEDIRDTLKWVNRLIIGAVLLAILALVLK